MKIAVHGSYYGRNFGDTLIIKIVCDWIKSAGDHEIVLPLVEVQEEAEEIGARKIAANEWDNIDLLIYAGGGYFGEPNIKCLQRHKWYYSNWKKHIRWLKRMKPKKIIAVGLGFGPINNTLLRRCIYDVFRKCEFIYFRDDESIKMANEYRYNNININSGVDLAHYVSEKVKVSEDKYRNNYKVGVHIPVVNSIYLEKYLQVLSFLSDEDNIEIITDNPSQYMLIENKQSFYAKIFKNRSVKVINYSGPEKLIKDIMTYKYIITSKLHVGIVASSIGIPVYSVPIHTKTERYYKQINYSMNCNPIYNYCMSKNDEFLKTREKLSQPQIPLHIYEKLETMKYQVTSLLK